MLTKIWESDYLRLIRAVYSEGAGTIGIDQQVKKVASLVTGAVRCYRVETETGAFAAIAVIGEGDQVLHQYMRPHFRAAYEAEFKALLASIAQRKQLDSADFQNVKG